jgi:hypothetical protein
MKRAIGSSVALCAIGVLCGSAQASVIYSIGPATIPVQPGDVGDSFDVFLTNSGPDSLSVAGFAFEVSVAATTITLTGASVSTGANPYIFAGDSFDQINGFSLVYVNTAGPSPQRLDASDITNVLAGIQIAPGGSIDLGKVFFDVANPAQAGNFAVSFTGIVSNVANANNLSTPEGDGIAVDSFSSGTIQVVPLPSPAVLFGSGVGALFALLGWGRGWPVLRSRSRRSHEQARATGC